MNLRFEREGNSVFLLLPKNEEGISYREKMTLEGAFCNLLPVRCRRFNGESSFCYDVRAMQSLKRVYDKKDMNAEAVRQLLTGLELTIQELAEYLLDPGFLLLDPDCVMLKRSEEQVRFCFYPESEETGGAKELGDFLITHVDNEDEEAVRLSYGFYELAREGSFDLGGLLRPEEIVPDTRDSVFEPVIPETMQAEENYYFREKDEEEEEVDLPKGSVLPPLIVSAVLIVLAGAGYIYVFMHPVILNSLGIRQEDYILAGAILTGVLALVIMLGLQFYNGRKNKTAAEDPEDSSSSDSSAAAHMDEHMSAIDAPGEAGDDGEETRILAVKEGEEEERRFLVGFVEGVSLRIDINKSPFSIGKSSALCDGVIDAPGISRIHAVFESSVSGWYVSDENSTNGTRVNGRLITSGEQQAVFGGDKISFGDHDFIYVE